MSELPEFKVKDFWVFSLAYAIALEKIIFGYKFLFLNQFSNSLQNILGQS